MGHRADLFNVKRNSQTVSKSLKLDHFILPLAIYESFNGSASLPTYSIYQCLYFSHSCGYVMVSCDFTLPFLDDY